MKLETLLALGALPPRQREALWDRVGLDRPTKEVAETMGISEVRVGQLVKAGTKNLSILLRKDS